MALFDTFSKTSKELDKELQQKLNKKIDKQSSGKGVGILQRIQEVTKRVNEHLGSYVDDYQLLITDEDVKEYFKKIRENGICSTDTETTGLNFFTDEIVGICLYTPGMRASYIPLNHISPVYQTRIENQADRELVKKEIQTLVDEDVKIVYHNAKFDLNILHTYKGSEMNEPYWDTLVCSYLITTDENERGLKAQYTKYCSHLEDENKLNSMNKFADLFDGLTFNLVPINVAVLYAARDAWMTFKLYEHQKSILEQEEYKDLYSLATDIEFPLVKVTADMQRTGVDIDFDKIDMLDTKYAGLVEETKQKVYDEINKYHDNIIKYKLTHYNHKLDDPINIGSPVQLATLLYDIIKLENPKKDNPRGTGEEIIKEIDHPITRAILEFRTVNKLYTTYIVALPKKIEPETKRIHASFNQNGADTGRFSSSDPNLQNIPRDGGIRNIFKAADGYVLVGSDYSQQEPRILAHLCGDEKMIQSYKDGKDLYSSMASLAFHVPYEQCHEVYLDDDGKKTDNPNKEGKTRRNQIKSVVLGLMYGRGTPSVAEQLGISTEEAQTIADSLFNAFPKMKEYIEMAQVRAKELGYTTTVWGRRRYLRYIQEEPYTFKYGINRPVDFDPLFDCVDDVSDEIPDDIKKMYLDKLSAEKSYYKRRKIFEDSEKNGIIISDNTRNVAEAERQCVNSEVQGSAADMTKKAMVALHRNKELKTLGYRLLMSVHDETIGECPYENRKEVARLCSKIMIEASDRVSVPMKCDVELSYVWYGDSVSID